MHEQVDAATCLGVVAADTGLVTPKAPVAGFPNRPEEAGESGGLEEVVVVEDDDEVVEELVVEVEVEEKVL